VVDRLVGDDAAFDRHDGSAAAGAIETKASMADAAAATEFAIWPVMTYLAGYFLFGAGYIAYMTFMIAYVRDAGGGAAAQSAFWLPDRPKRVRNAVGMA